MNEMRSFLSTHNMDNCSGCGACLQICPKHCIVFEKKEDGFLYPKIDNTQCIKCKKCERVCPYNVEVVTTLPLAAFAAKAKDPKIIMKSSSGGIFYILSKKCISQGGVVFGATMNDDFSCEHKSADTVDKLQNLLKSKYVQSRTEMIFSDVLDNIRVGKKTLFCGTPCQIAGLLDYLGEYSQKDNFICIDIACHGVPSYADLKRCIEYIEKKHNGKLTQLSFRDKQRAGWKHSLTYTIKKADKERIYTKLPYQILYYYFFLYSRNLRKSCYSCNYAKKERISDITLSDFWAIGKADRKFNAKMGVSGVLCNTKKGCKYFESIYSEIDFFQTKVEMIATNNQPFNKPSKKYNKRKELLNDVLIYGYETAEIYLTKKERVIASIKASIPDRIKDKIGGL